MPRRRAKVQRTGYVRSQQSIWADLPIDLQDIIADKLSHTDKAKMSVACKDWKGILSRGRLRFNLKVQTAVRDQDGFCKWVEKHRPCLSELVITCEDPCQKFALDRKISSFVIPGLTGLTSLHLSNSKNIQMAVLAGLEKLQTLELVCCQVQVGRGYKGSPAEFPLLGCNTRLRKLALTSSTLNLYHSPILTWDLPNLGFLKLDGLHAVNAGSTGGSQVQINCSTSSKLTSLQCLKRLNMDWKDSTPPPGFCFGPQSLTGLTTLAASCGVMTLDLAALQLRDLCLDYFTPSSITHGFPTTLRLLELRLGTLWGGQATIQAVLQPLIRSCKHGLRLEGLVLNDSKGRLASPFFDFIDYGHFLKPLLGLQRLELQTSRIHLQAAFQALGCISSLQKLAVTASYCASDHEELKARLVLPLLKNLRLEAAARQLDLQDCESLKKVEWVQPSMDDAKTFKLLLPVTADKQHKLLTPTTCWIVADSLVLLTKPDPAPIISYGQPPPMQDTPVTPNDTKRIPNTPDTANIKTPAKVARNVRIGPRTSPWVRRSTFMWMRKV